ncbi:hypothetical protein BDV59DRAFT_48070 [Aspergillus ambiguus]|uniref:uncharacterized protein n=1 Tax=Aspergillus ambiguus TaxID=176160 RepID=UPI003CCDC218
MLSPSACTRPRQAPPVRPSRSLEGLEQVIPPRIPLPPARPVPHLDKPLPDLPCKPLPETPSMEGSTAWSDDSSIDESFTSRRPSDVSAESFPVFVRSGSDDLSDLEEHPVLDAASASVDAWEKPRPSPVILTPAPEDRYQRPPLWTGNRTGPNHYFREKKWDFFPELATPSELQACSPNKFTSKPPKKDGSLLHFPPFDFVRRGSHRGGLAHDMRASIRSYVQRRLSKHSIDKEKPKRPPRPATAPSDYTHRFPFAAPRAPSSNYTNYSDRGSVGPQLHSIDVNDQMRRFSVSTRSSVGELARPARVNRPKQLAVPISAYQKHGAAIWEKPGREKRVSYRQRDHVRFPRYHQHKASSSRTGVQHPRSTPATRPARVRLQKNTRECVRALHHGTSNVLLAIGEARQRMIRARVDRRRKRLKAQIRLIGPVNPYTTYGRVDPWV